MSDCELKNIYFIFLSYLWTTASFSWSVWRSNISKSKASLAGPKIPPGILRKNFFRTEAMVLTEKLWMFTKRPEIVKWKILLLQIILFEIDCAIFYTNLHKLFFQFISQTNWVISGKFMDNCWISCQVRADMKEVYNDLIIINL